MTKILVVDDSAIDRRLAGSLPSLDDGGAVLNWGSAVVLPEVFLKAVSLARNRGCRLDGLTTVTFDFAKLYRPQVNVVSRPTAGIGHGYYLVGHHELMIPLLAAALETANVLRRDVTRSAVAEARALVADEDPDLPATLVRGPWPAGIVGLVAARLAEERGRPAVVARFSHMRPTTYPSAGSVARHTGQVRGWRSLAG